MKKQFLFILTLALLASIQNVFGQSVTHEAPQPFVCTTSGPLNPVAGVSYDYSATVAPTGGTFHWWATTDQNFISASANNIGTALTVNPNELLNTSPNYASVPGTAEDQVSITWSSPILNAAQTTPTFVVVQYDAPAAGCANNLKVYKIDPINGFTVDILNLDASQAPLSYGTPFSTCVSNIESAQYSGGAIVTDYGTNVLYFEVVAANISGTWTPSLVASGMQPGQSAVVEWAYELADFATPALVHPAGDVVTIDPSVTNPALGASIFVRVTVDNGTHEGLADVPITLTANGTDQFGNPDVINDDCANTSVTDDIAIQTLKARPTVTAGGTLNFVTP
jgi:hypothetical protein